MLAESALKGGAMNEWVLVDADEVRADEQNASEPAVDHPGSRRRLDPIAHAWRACNPGTPLPPELCLAVTRRFEPDGHGTFADRYYGSSAPTWALLAMATRERPEET
jgi:hypothetical protein